MCVCVCKHRSREECEEQDWRQLQCAQRASGTLAQGCLLLQDPGSGLPAIPGPGFKKSHLHLHQTLHSLDLRLTESSSVLGADVRSNCQVGRLISCLQTETQASPHRPSMQCSSAPSAPALGGVVAWMVPACGDGSVKEPGGRRR